MARMLALEQAAFDQAHPHAREPERMGLVAAVVARDVERAEQLAAPVEDRRRAAGEHAVAVEVVLGAEHLDRRTLDQGGADRVGAALAFAPVRARLQRDAVGAVDEGGVADAVQDHPAGVGEQHHAARGTDLFVQVLHDATGVREQGRAALARHHQVAPRGAGRAHALAHVQSQALAARPGAQHRHRQARVGHLAGGGKLPAQRLDHRRLRGTHRVIDHRLLSTCGRGAAAFGTPRPGSSIVVEAAPGVGQRPSND